MPPSYYKYRAIDDDTTEGLAKNYAIDALFKCHAKFSRPTDFNDLFDCKVDFTDPTAEEIMLLLRDPRCEKSSRKYLRKCLSGDTISFLGISNFRKARVEIKKKINNYYFFCLSKDCTHNLMWAHYASEHHGFCIEFQFPGKDQPEKVCYSDHIPSIPLIKFYEDTMTNTDNGITKCIKCALCTKLKYWEYEQEYRCCANEIPDETSIKIGDSRFETYEASCVKSVIFGRRMSSRAKQFIINNLPFHTEFKQAIEARESIEIESYDAEKHLHYGDSMDAAH